MAQGNLKVKANKAGIKQKNKNQKSKVKQSGITKKGPHAFAPKKGPQLGVHKVKKSISKGINQHIETEVAARAHQLEEGKGFRVIPTPKSNPSKKDKKKQQQKK